MTRWTRSAVALAGATALVCGVTATATAAPRQDGGRHQISEAPAWTAKAASSRKAPVSSGLHAKVWLTVRDRAALEAQAKAVSDPDSADYGKYLTPDQYRATYAATADTVSAVSAWLKGAGLSVDSVGPDNHYVAVSGSAAAMNTAFTAGLANFTLNGRSGNAPTTAVTVPDALGGAVLAVTGLDTVNHWVSPSSSNDQAQDIPGAGSRVGASTTGPKDLGPAPGFANADPCSDYYGQKVDTTDPKFQGKKLPYVVCGYIPSQYRSVYGVTASGRSGREQTVAITDAFASPTILQDANEYATRHGDKKFRGGQFTQTNNTAYDPARVADCGGNGWYGEETLDVEAVHGIAPDANVAYYGAASCYDDDLMGALSQIVTDNNASIVSNSWGEPSFVDVEGVKTPTFDQALLDAYDSIFAQGALQGIGFYFSSGDNGDEQATNGYIQTDLPVSSKWVTAVGGTSLAIDKRGNRIFETGWGTEKYSLASGKWNPVGFVYGAGGGCSEVFTQPYYQTGAKTGCPMRGVPDVAMDGDPTTGMLVGQTQVFSGPNKWGQGIKYGEYRIGGTSLSAPLFAGEQAVAQQGRMRIGFANPTIYSVATKRGVFFDVTPQGDLGNVRVDFANRLNATGGFVTSVRTFNQDSSLATGKGWDNVTGVGTPTLDYIRAVSHR